MEPITITIAGVGLKITPKFLAGHVLTENEALGLNSALIDNIRNNFAGTVKKLKGEDESVPPEKIPELQTALDTYVESYEFSPRRTPKESLDPITKMAYSLAREAIKAALRQKGIDQKSLPEAWWDDNIPKVLESKPELMEEAKRRYAAQKAMASSLLDSMP